MLNPNNILFQNIIVISHKLDFDTVYNSYVGFLKYAELNYRSYICRFNLLSADHIPSLVQHLFRWW